MRSDRVVASWQDPARISLAAVDFFRFRFSWLRSQLPRHADGLDRNATMLAE